MLRDLLKEGGLYTLANLVTKGIGLLLIPFYSDYFTQSEYGILALLGISGALVAAIFSFQVYQGVGRYISEKTATLTEQQKIGSTGLTFTLLSYIVFLVIAILFKNPILDYLTEEERIKDTTYYWWLCALFVNGIFYTFGVELRFLRKTTAYSLTSFLHAIGNILVILTLTLGVGLRLESIFIASAIVTPLIIGLQFYYLRNYFILYLGKIELVKLLKFSAPLIPASIAYLILNFTDRIFIKELSSSFAEVGIYDMGFKFSAIVSLIIVAFQSALAPLIYEKHQEQHTKKELGRILRLFIGFGSLGILCLSSFTFETLYVFTQPEYYAASYLMPLFYLSVFATGFAMFSPGIQLKNRTELIPVIVLVSGSVNVVLNIWLIPSYGLIGAALATLFSTLINNTVLFIVAQRLYYIPYPSAKIIRVFSVFSLLFILNSYQAFIIELNYALSLLIKVGMIIIYVLFLMKIKFINFSQLLERLKLK